MTKVIKKSIDSKRTDTIGARAFWQKIEEAFKDGWTVSTSKAFKDCPRFYPYPIVFLEKEVEGVAALPSDKNEAGGHVEQVEIKEDSGSQETEKEDALKGVSTKEDLKAFADQNNIPLPEYLKQPSAIKKYLREQLDSKQ